jgi:predicted ATPase
MIFINYRKQDTQAVADHLAFRLREQFGNAGVFKDDYDLQGGDRWPDRLYEELLHRRVLVALIGHQWLLCQDQNGQRRLADPEDWVRRELCTALEQNKSVLVLLVAGAPMPGIDDLPDGPLRKLRNLQAMPLRPGIDFESDLARLIGRLGQLLEGLSTSQAPAVQVPLGKPQTGPPSNLPVPANSFVGRGRESRELARLLAGGTGTTLVTLCGPPGTGKTRLAIEVGRKLLASFPGGCWLADLAETRTAADIAQAVAEAFGVPLMGNVAPVDGVASFLEYRRPLLLLLDNFEQIVEHAPVTLGPWRRKAPQVSFLVTSRSLLGLAGEREYHLDPLPIPHEEPSSMTVMEIGAYESVKLFEDRARQVRPLFALDEKNARAVGEICARLDGIPLAIEMAAARVRILQPVELLERLSLRFDVLRSHRRDVHRRHQTLLAAIEWSYALLEPCEKEGFLQASIFRGGFFLDAAEAVLDLSAYPNAPQVLDVVQELWPWTATTRQTPWRRPSATRFLLPASQTTEGSSSTNVGGYPRR